MEFDETYQKSDFGKVWFYQALAGGVKFALYVYDDDPNVMYIADVRVSKIMQKQGFGNEIIKEAERQTLMKGYNILELQVLDKSWMHQWYIRHGFKNLCFNEDNSDYIWMKKILNKKRSK